MDYHHIVQHPSGQVLVQIVVVFLVPYCYFGDPDHNQQRALIKTY